MVRIKHKVSEPPQSPVKGVRAATLQLLLDTAMGVIRSDGHIPSVAEVAKRCAVSRATAYRYFPTRSALITAVIEASLGPVRTMASDKASGRERVRELFLRTFPRFTEFEPQLRAAAQLSLEQSALERAGLLEEEPYRRGHRIRILEHAIAPLAPQLPGGVRDRLHHALSVVYGIEPYIILKDIWGLADREIERVALWMADALIDAALQEALPTPRLPMPPPSPTAVAMPAHPAAWYDDQYNNRGRIPEHPAILQQWFERSAQARARLSRDLDVPYGSAPSERLDVFFPATPTQGAPVLVYIHGGYWRALDKKDQSFVAAPFVQRGAVVVLPNYALAPAVTLAQIVLQMVQAVAWVWRHIGRYGGDPQRIVVAGHSAGGHLAAMLMACHWPDVAPAAADAAAPGGDRPMPADVVKAALALSGVFELEPLRHAPFLSSDLNLSEADALRLSPASLPAPAQGRLLALVGGDESEEFLRQNELIRSAWGDARVPVCEAVPGRHHMNVLHDLAEPGRRVHELALGLLGLA
jgi:acetyl esterase/lipase/AcrR family transcriptional regulator